MLFCSLLIVDIVVGYSAKLARVQLALISLSPTSHSQGTSTKYSPQRVGLQHLMDDEDVIQIVKK